MYVKRSIILNNINFKQLFIKIAGFSTVGAITSFLGIIAVYLFIGKLKTPLYLTYAVIYFFSILISYLLNIKFIFRLKSTKKRTIIYFIIYISSMILGLLLLILYKSILPFENWIISYLTIPFTLTWNFVFSYFLLPKL